MTLERSIIMPLRLPGFEHAYSFDLHSVNLSILATSPDSFNVVLGIAN